MNRSAIFASILSLLVFAGCLGSTGTNESCDDHNRQEQAAYIEQYAENENVSVTRSGLHYRVIEKSEGIIPTASDSVEVEFIGRFIDGTIFDTTDNLPNGLRFKVEKFNLEGVREGILLMEEGSTYELVVPSHLGFRETAAGEICPGTTLIFELSLVNVFN